MKNNLFFLSMVLTLLVLPSVSMGEGMISIMNPNSDISTVPGMNIMKYEVKKNTGETVKVDLIASEPGLIILRDGNIAEGTRQPVKYTIHFKEGEYIAPKFKAPKGGIDITYLGILIDGGKLIDLKCLESEPRKRNIQGSHIKN